MDFLTRRTIRKYSEKQISKDEVEKILEVALTSPSGKNLKPYQYIVVTDKEKLKALSKAKNGGGMPIAEAPMAIAVLGEKNTSDTWVEDCSIASILIQLKAWELGIGSCWVQMRERKDENGNLSENISREILGVPSELGVLCIISLGYPDEEKAEYAKGNMDFSKVHYEKF